MTGEEDECILCVYMSVESRVARYGNSLTVRIPIGVAREIGFRDGDRVELRIVDGAVVIERSARSRLAARLATVREPEPEVRTGRALGAEMIE